MHKLPSVVQRLDRGVPSFLKKKKKKKRKKHKGFSLSTPLFRLPPAYLALAQGALCAVFNPGGAAEAWDVVLVCARLGDVVADGVGLAGVSDTAGTALALGHHSKLAVHRGARQRPAVHLPLLRRDIWDRKKTQNNLCKCSLTFCTFLMPKQVTHANTHISPDVMYLYAKGTVSAWRRKKNLLRYQENIDEQSNLPLFHSQQFFFHTVEVKCSSFLIDLF